MPHDSSSGPTCHRPSEAATVGQRKQDHGRLLIGYYGTCMLLLLLLLSSMTMTVHAGCLKLATDRRME
jgi:hypothetical protein